MRVHYLSKFMDFYNNSTNIVLLSKDPYLLFIDEVILRIGLLFNFKFFTSCTIKLKEIQTDRTNDKSENRAMNKKNNYKIPIIMIKCSSRYITTHIK